MPKVSGLNRRSASFADLEIGVFLGGNSPERSISLRSGRAVCQALRRAGFRVRQVDPGRRRPSEIRKLNLDVAFLALHGRGGEDGRIQKWLSGCRLPYTGSDEAGCRQAFDKFTAKELFRKNGVPTPDYTVINKRNYASRLAAFPVPFFVKPLDDGSSLGVSCVHDLVKSMPAIRRSLDRYGKLLIEKKVEGREFTVGILGERALPVIELKPKRDFYDYKAKYTKGFCRYLIPAPVSPKQAEIMRQCALEAHRALGLRDFSRVDIMTGPDGRPWVLEVNAIPGFTEMSLLPKAAQAAGISFEQLCSKLIMWAWQRSKRVPRKNRRK